MIKSDHVLIHVAILVGVALLLYKAFFDKYGDLSLVTNV